MKQVYLTLDSHDREILKQLVSSPDTPPAMAKRAKMLLLKEQGRTAQEIAEQIGAERKSVEKWVNLYRNRPRGTDVVQLLSDREGRGRKREIDEAAAAWIREKAKECRSTAELVRTVQAEAEAAGFPRLSTISRSSVVAIISDK